MIFISWVAIAALWVAIAATVWIVLTGSLLLVFSMGGDQSNKQVKKNESKAMLSMDNYSDTLYHTLYHISENGPFTCYNPAECDLPKVVHYTGTLTEETMSSWMEWREEMISRESKLADIRGYNSWHVEDNLIQPCLNHLRRRNCNIPESRHFDSYEEAVCRAKDHDWREYNLLNVAPLYCDSSKFTDFFLKLHNERTLKENGHQVVQYEAQRSVVVEKIVENPESSINQIKLEIGELRGDICWVIDNPAFFDSNSPVSTDLFLKLAEWDDNHSTWDFQKKSQNSAIIQELFETAKKGAIDLGFDYLHGNTRTSMEKASNLARKALSTTHVAEQASIMEKVAEILAGVMGISIPNRTVKAIEEYSKKAIS